LQCGIKDNAVVSLPAIVIHVPSPGIPPPPPSIPAPPPSVPPPPPIHQIKVLTYNIYWKAMTGNPGAGDLQPKGTVQSHIARFIDDNMPYDFVALQEASEYATVTGSLGTTMGHRHTVSGSDEMYTYYDNTKYHCAYDIATEFTAGRPIHILGFDEDIIFINLHGSHSPLNFDIINTAINSASIASKTYFFNIIQKPIHRIIMAGDFNHDFDRIDLNFDNGAGIAKTITVKNIIASKRKPTCCIQRVPFTGHTHIYDHVFDSEEPIDITIGTPITPASDHLPVISYLKPLSAIGGGLIMDQFGLLPRADQHLVGLNYELTNVSNEFLNIFDASKPVLVPFQTKIQTDKPTIINIDPPVSLPPLLPPINKHRTHIPKGIQNVGNSCYFNVMMQLLFTIGAFRDNFIADKTSLDPTEQFISTTFEEMKTGNITNPNIALYNQFKTAYFGAGSTTEEDPMEFFIKLCTNVNAYNPALLTMTQALASVAVSIEITNKYPVLGSGLPNNILSTNKTIDFYALVNMVIPNVFKIINDPGTDFMKVLNTYYSDIDLQNASDAISYNSQYIYGYIVSEYLTLPNYFIFQINLIDYAKNMKISHNININKFITITNKTKTKTITYIMSAMILHRGPDFNSGHYTIYVFDRVTGTKMNYTLYDDSSSIQKEETYDLGHLNKTNYHLDLNDTPYVLLYRNADMFA
jgi:endonuclease/exonuclease/phosphatase family metal-dependent hydrolase